jgi:CBS domain-containing protein
LLDGMTTVRDIMSKDLVAVEPASTVAEAATMMGERHVGSALVIEDDRAAGIFTERDVLRALASDFDAAHHPVADWMTHDPTTVDVAADVRTARNMMLDGGFRHLPVLEFGRLVGIVSLRDISRAYE